MVGIYKITNPNGKVYIGQSVDLDDRRKDYTRGGNKSQTRLYNSIRKYGWESHSWEILCECELNQLNELERHYQELYKAVEHGLNCRYTETNEKSGKLSEETKRRMRRPKSPRSEEHCRKLSEYAKSRSLPSEETKRKTSNTLKGIVRSEDTKKKLSERAKNRTKKTCPHCGKIGDPGLMVLWHFDKCRKKVSL